MEKRFEGQIAVVTGGADGIGKSIVKRLATEGARVTLFDVNLQKAETTAGELAEEGINVDYEIVDISSKRQVKSSIASVVARNGGNLDIMINCAGIVGPTSTDIESVSMSDFDKVFEVNVRGTFLMTKYAVKAMKKNGYGRILNFSSIAGKEGNAGMSPYSASKSAVIGLVKAAGKEYATTGITINAIAPAVIQTPMVEGIDPAQVEYMTSRIPMKRCGTLEEITSLSCWIVSPEASYNTGFIFDLTGGRAVY
ncbi:MAG: SDR family NAD(P)-dependent oxidoreductase [Verrucomicrobiales bacterium]|nr:SDR family NAD(P)-dependent oxidoreductase [Verrucomicrobiales bacterium]